MKRSLFEPGEFQKCVHWQDIFNFFKGCARLYIGSTILSKWSIVIMKTLREPDVKRLSKLEGNVRRDFP